MLVSLWHRDKTSLTQRQHGYLSAAVFLEGQAASTCAWSKEGRERVEWGRRQLVIRFGEAEVVRGRSGRGGS